MKVTLTCESKKEEDNVANRGRHRGMVCASVTLKKRWMMLVDLGSNSLAEYDSE